MKKQSAEDRIKAAFLRELAECAPAPDPRVIARLRAYVGAHFETFCGGLPPVEDPDGVIRRIIAYLHPVDYHKLSVSALTKRAGVNRTTFYRFYGNLDALYEACCADLTAQALAVPLPAEKTPETMLNYANRLWEFLSRNEAPIMLLSHRVGLRTMPYTIGMQLREKMAASLSPRERSSFTVSENLELFPEAFANWIGLIQLERIAPDAYPVKGLPVYDPSRSLIENLSAFFARRYGGNEAFYYALGLAALKLLTQKDYRKIGVSELCAAAGYPRSRFYAAFPDMADYIMKICENGVLVCMSAFLFFMGRQDLMTTQSMKIFRGEMVGFKTEGIRQIFINGSISYLFSPLIAYIFRILLRQSPAAARAADRESVNALISYYVIFALQTVSKFYIADLSETELALKKETLNRLRGELGF